MTAYAHTHPEHPEDHSKWEPLFTPFGSGTDQCQREHCQKCRDMEPYHGHLNKVAWWSAKFAAAMFPPGSDRDAAWQWGFLAGLWHDLGKFHPRFQRRLNGERVQIEHSGAGALLAKERLVPNWEIIAFAIAGHHCGLANAINRESTKDTLAPLDERLQRAVAELTECRSVPDPHLNGMLELPLEPFSSQGLFKPHSIELGNFIRLIFSALVDADSLATEAFCSPREAKTLLRHSPLYDSIEVLHGRLNSHLEEFSRSSKATPVNTERARILDWCRNAVSQPPGFFQLNVPTGGGKTLSGMAFALGHADHHQTAGMRRIIIAVPYTSIIEQNAEIYRTILGPQNVIEHHSNLDDFSEDDAESDELAIRRRLACENWDAPVVITTNVQLFESLFTNKRRRARKLHNLAGSVIILDEAQCMPAEYLHLILTSLKDLVANYGCSVVISTATQPAWKIRRTLPFGIQPDHLRPIVPANIELSKLHAFNRVNIKWPQTSRPTSHEELAGLLAAEPCVMAIVHRKKDAQFLAKHLKSLKPGELIFHLSTNMCPVHRRQVLEEIHEGLIKFREQGTPCRVVSTQLVEAGVDLSFPTIYRALAGLDSIAQAAGRCNRSGEFRGKGRVIVFIAETDPPDGYLKHCAQVTEKMLSEHGQSLDLLDSASFEEYFVRLYRDRNLDLKALVRHAQDLNFETLGREFRLIEDGDQTPIVILFDEEARSRLSRIEGIAARNDEAVATRFALRALQPYTVLVRPKGMANLRTALRPLFEGALTFVLDPDFYVGCYDFTYGLTTDDEPQIPPDRLIVG